MLYIFICKIQISIAEPFSFHVFCDHLKREFVLLSISKCGTMFCLSGRRQGQVTSASLLISGFTKSKSPLWQHKGVPCILLYSLILTCVLHIEIHTGKLQKYPFTRMFHTASKGQHFVYWSSRKLTLMVGLMKESPGLLHQAWSIWLVPGSMYTQSSLIKPCTWLRVCRISISEKTGNWSAKVKSIQSYPCACNPS